MKDNFQVLGDEFAFSCMIGDPDCGCFPADGRMIASDSKWVSKGLWDYPNIVDYPVDGIKLVKNPNVTEQMFPVNGRVTGIVKGGSVSKPKCPDGWETDNNGLVASCRKTKSTSQFSGANGYNNLVDTPADSDTKKEGSGGKIDADTITAGLETAGAVVALLGNKRTLSEVEGVCGKQPKPIIGGKAKKQAWASCASNYMNSKLKDASRKDEQGLSTGAIVGIALGSVVIIGGLFVLAIKMKSKAQVTVAPAPVAPIAPVVK